LTNESIIEKEGRRILKRFRVTRNLREIIALVALRLTLSSAVCDAETKGFLDERSDPSTADGFSGLKASFDEL
jgi:hypothetical protein